MMYATLCNNCVSELANRIGITTQNHGFQTMIVIEMRMHGGHREVMPTMLQRIESLRQVTLMMIKHVRQTCNASQ